MIKLIKIIGIPIIAINALASTPIIDGTLNDSEWADAKSYELEFEVSPGRNAPALLKLLHQSNMMKTTYMLLLKPTLIKKKLEQPPE